MYQQSVDRSGGSQKSDLILFIVLIIAFFAVGAVVMYLEKLFDSNVPRYVFIGLVLAAIYAIYRLRIIGFRYTVFYKEPETVYDPRFGLPLPCRNNSVRTHCKCKRHNNRNSLRR